MLPKKTVYSRLRKPKGSNNHDQTHPQLPQDKHTTPITSNASTSTINRNFAQNFIPESDEDKVKRERIDALTSHYGCMREQLRWEKGRGENHCERGKNG